MTDQKKLILKKSFTLRDILCSECRNNLKGREGFIKIKVKSSYWNNSPALEMCLCCFKEKIKKALRKKNGEKILNERTKKLLIRRLK